ncbi:ABC transporter ATP-binding protein [Halosimplex halobium]|uniref:ABC transporter ATP-binding protein n=1 Tax=Halosimplex halobium TaxID=3396618 RepID=UPI003F574F08
MTPSTRDGPTDESTTDEPATDRSTADGPATGGSASGDRSTERRAGDAIFRSDLGRANRSTADADRPSGSGDGPRVRIDGVGKRYGDEWALRDVTLDLDSGVVGLLGPNGAGKSTLLGILTTFTAPTEGTVTVDGVDVSEDPTAVRSRLGYLPQEFGVYPDLTAREFLEYLGALRGLDRATARERAADLLAVVNLADAADRRLDTFSGGMVQRVGIAQALLSDPDVLVVDEPTVGLDPTERARCRAVLAELARDRVVVLSTHIVSDVEATASEVAVLVDGRLRTHTDPETLIGTVEGRVWECVVGDDAPLAPDHLVTNTARRSDGRHVRAVADDPPTDDAAPVDPTLEDAYLALLEGNDSGGGERP